NWCKYSGYLMHEIVYGCCGIHPMFSHQYNLAMELHLRTALSNKHIIGLGEIGIDLRSPGHPSLRLQQEVFLNQLQLAKELNLPVMIISRNSFTETIDALLQVLNFEYYIIWRNFEYGTVELDLLNSKFSNIYFGCSPYHITNRELQQVIQQVDIKRIIPESAAPHLQIPEGPNIWESHPLFVGRVYQLIAELFDIPLREASNQLLKNFETFHIIDSFRPDDKSNSFPRLRSDMYIASCTAKCFSLAMIQQKPKPYIHDDTMFIKAMVDFGDMSKTPMHIQQLLIKKEGERKV
ncbi:unnamed protein product, partial [Rotaria magnacalcarata]